MLLKLFRKNGSMNDYSAQERYRLKNRDKILEKGRKYRRNNHPLFLFNSAKSRSKKRRMDFNIEVSDIVIPEYCPILKVKLEYGHSRYGPTLDRIDPTKGYVKGNVWVISFKANSMKNDATPDELKLFAEWINK